MAVPETEARDRIKEIVEDAFSGVTVESTKLLRAAGRDGSRRVATSPDQSAEVRSNVNELEVDILLQWYEGFPDEPEESRTVDPSDIETTADGLRRAFGAEQGGVSADQWFIRLRRIEFPDDPTGHKSRLEAFITAWCENPASLG